MKKKKTLKVFEGFAGYGGASFGLKRSGLKHKVIGYSEIDKPACILFEKNFPGIKNYGDITKLAPEVIILGGGLMGSSDVFKEHIKKYNAKIEFAVMGNKAGALGASILIRRELENGRKVN